MVLPEHSNRKQLWLEVVMALASQIILFLGVTPYILVHKYQRFEECW
jgi:hypothetical protein